MFLKPKQEVISGDDFEMIHQATLRLLEDTGIVFDHEEVLKIFKDHGAAVDGNLVRLPQKLVEERVKMAPSKFRWQSRNNQRSVVMGEGPVLQPAAGPVYVHDLDRGRRPAMAAIIFCTNPPSIGGVHHCHFAVITTAGKRKAPGTLCSGPVKPTKRFWQPHRIP